MPHTYLIKALLNYEAKNYYKWLLLCAEALILINRPAGASADEIKHFLNKNHYKLNDSKINLALIKGLCVNIFQIKGGRFSINKYLKRIFMTEMKTKTLKTKLPKKSYVGNEFDKVRKLRKERSYKRIANKFRIEDEMTKDHECKDNNLISSSSVVKYKFSTSKISRYEDLEEGEVFSDSSEKFDDYDQRGISALCEQKQDINNQQISDNYCLVNENVLKVENAQFEEAKYYKETIQQQKSLLISIGLQNMANTKKLEDYLLENSWENRDEEYWLQKITGISEPIIRKVRVLDDLISNSYQPCEIQNDEEVSIIKYPKYTFQRSLSPKCDLSFDNRINKYSVDYMTGTYMKSIRKIRQRRKRKQSKSWRNKEIRLEEKFNNNERKFNESHTQGRLAIWRYFNPQQPYDRYWKKKV